MRIAWLWMVVVAWAGAARADDLTQPGPGRVPLLVESSRAQTVSIELTAPDAPAGAIAIGPDAPRPDRAQCVTPCTLYVPPGPVVLHTHSAAVRAATATVDVPEGGLGVRVRAPSRVWHDVGTGLVTVGAGGLLGILLVHGLVDSAGNQAGHFVQGLSDTPDNEDRHTPVSRREGIALVSLAGTAVLGGIILILNRTGVSSRRRLGRAAAALGSGVSF